jgi:hypothetical protein
VPDPSNAGVTIDDLPISKLLVDGRYTKGTRGSLKHWNSPAAAMSVYSYRSSEGSDIEVVIKGPNISCAPASVLQTSDALEVLDAFPGHKSQLGTSSSVMQEQVRSLGHELQKDL